MSHKTYNVKIVKCSCSKCVPRKIGEPGSFSWYCNYVGKMFEVDDYEYSPKEYWHIVGKPQQPSKGCWISKKDTEIIYIDDKLPLSLFVI